MTRRVWQIVTEIPVEAGDAICEAMFHAVATAAHDAEPESRDGWDVSVHASVVEVAWDDE